MRTGIFFLSTEADCIVLVSSGFAQVMAKVLAIQQGWTKENGEPEELQFEGTSPFRHQAFDSHTVVPMPD